MKNSLTGQIEFELNGMPYVLKLNINALCAIEETLACSVNELQDRLNNPETFRIADMRAMFYACLSNDGNVNRPINVEQAGEVMDALGFERVAELMGEVVQAAFPQDEGEPVPEGKGKPAG